MTNTDTQTQKQPQQKVGINPNPTYIQLSEDQDLSAHLEMARMQIITLKEERDAIAGTVNRLDKELAIQKDETAKQQQINQGLFKSFQDLYGIYSQLYDQIITSNTALTITTGKLAECLVKYKFTIPQQEQPST